MSTRLICGIALALITPLAHAQKGEPFDAAAAFGARESVMNMSLSPDGEHVAYVAPGPGQGSALFTLSLEKGAHPRQAAFVDGKPDRLGDCTWVANDRLACRIYGVARNALAGLLRWSRMVSLDADGKNLKLLSTQENPYSRGWALGGGAILDWLPDENGSVLMARAYLPDDHTGSHFGSSESGMGVDSIDTRTLRVSHVERPNPNAVDYVTDGRGVVRIMGLMNTSNGGREETGVVHYLYRSRNSRDWQDLADYNTLTDEGFSPRAVDRDLNVVYGLKKKDGLKALYSISLDGSLQEEMLYSRPDVDVDTVIRLGRRQRVVGVSYVTDTRHAVYLSPDVKQLLESLGRALPGSAVRVVDSSTDENRLLIFAGTDDDPGVYYLFDRKTKQLQTFLVVRDSLEGIQLAKEKPITYPSSDGVMVPAYLTLPPGRENAKGLPAIVLPHGGPSARDEWGFDWLSQFFANRGYAVLQPNFRGSTGYGDAWFEENGFHSWPVAIGDVLAAGRWLVSQGIADPAKLGIFGWSYGGYAALQSAVVDPNVFKAVIAVAPVTDLPALKEEFRKYTSYAMMSQMVGDGPQTHEGSPVEHADKIKVPVLLFHGAEDTNVNIAESEHMAARLKAAGGRVELVTWSNLDHYLDDSAARTQMLKKSDEFLRQAFGPEVR
ncbi:MAG TPA: S9 family peptidase [Steroidobacteraceae bacterium]|nr:S9 family peptidase [Steroidobacteraceae bacterium]